MARTRRAVAVGLALGLALVGWLAIRSRRAALFADGGADQRSGALSVPPAGDPADDYSEMSFIG